jgi:predicted Zn-ribbon and HTH transcriptional regulator
MEGTNSRQAIELGGILREAMGEYPYKLSKEQYKAVKGIISCRTMELGGHVKACAQCGFARQAYNSCRNRHCPKCQSIKQSQWVDKLAGNLIPGKYFHVVFTLPHELLPLMAHNKRGCYDILFKASSQALLKAAGNIDFLGAQAGAVAILHTWAQTLLYHPHIHMIVPAGGLSEDGMEWKTAKKKFFLPATALSGIFRGIMVRYLKEALEKGSIKLPGGIPCFSSLKTKLYKKDWNVYLKKAFGGANSVLKYLGQYTHRVAISNSRLVSAGGGKVTFKYKDNRSKGKVKVMELETNEFIRRFLQHVLPENFYKIRYIGILSMVNAQTKKAQCIALINAKTYMPMLEGLNAVDVVESIVIPDILLCPKCKKGRMVYKIRGDS